MRFQIGKYLLDEEQTAVVLNDAKYTLVVAGAGSGKTLTILGKLYYLIYHQHLLPEEIICISFTRASANSLKYKILHEIKKDIPVYTFHQLSLSILRNQEDFDIADSELLESIIDEFFDVTVMTNELFMKKALKYFGIRVDKNFRRNYLNLLSNQEMILLKKLIATFIRLFKCNGFTLSDFTVFLKNIRKTIHYTRYQQEKTFLLFAINIYLIYQNYLNENHEIDFDDMIINAKTVVDEKEFFKNIKYVIIDEYQDTSYIRFQLIKSILDSTCASMLVVGDDFQSIYRFTGCDVSLFLNFKDFFKNANIMKISNTYRNSQELIDIANSFIRKNPYQIKKTLISSKHLKNPVKIIYYDNIRESFLRLVLEIYRQFEKPILVLGRNNSDVYKVLDKRYFKLNNDGKIVYLKNPNIIIQFFTIHKSKGLEEENVIIINLEDGLLGFPNKIKDDRILRLVVNNFEKYPFSEERRLFYVALTRTKNYVYLLVPKKNVSSFVHEIKKLL